MKHRNRNMPQDSKILEWHGFLGFPTRIRYQLTNMEEVEWVSRQQRKQRRLPLAGRTREWWESERISQWMCVLFMIGSFAFAAGAILCFDLSNRENAGENKDNADKLRISTPETSHLVEGQT